MWTRVGEFLVLMTVGLMQLKIVIWIDMMTGFAHFVLISDDKWINWWMNEIVCLFHDCASKRDLLMEVGLNKGTNLI